MKIKYKNFTVSVHFQPTVKVFYSELMINNNLIIIQTSNYEAIKLAVKESINNYINQNLF